MEKAVSNLEKIKSLAVRRLELYENIYDITSRNKFKGEQSEIDAFAEYLELRETYYKEAAELDKEENGALKTFKIDFNNEDALYRDISQILSNAQDVGKQIYELDVENNLKMDKVHKSLMSEVKHINENKRALNSYRFFQAQSDIGNRTRG